MCRRRSLCLRVAGGCKKGAKKKAWSSVFQDAEEEKIPSPPPERPGQRIIRKRAMLSAFQDSVASDREEPPPKPKKRLISSIFQEEDDEQGELHDVFHF